MCWWRGHPAHKGKGWAVRTAGSNEGWKHQHKPSEDGPGVSTELPALPDVPLCLPASGRRASSGFQGLAPNGLIQARVRSKPVIESCPMRELEPGVFKGQVDTGSRRGAGVGRASLALPGAVSGRLGALPTEAAVGRGSKAGGLQLAPGWCQ